MITRTAYVVDRTEYINPDDPTGDHLFRITISDSAPSGGGSPMLPLGMTRVLTGLVATDADALTPGAELTVTYAPSA